MLESPVLLLTLLLARIIRRNFLLFLQACLILGLVHVNYVEQDRSIRVLKFEAKLVQALKVLRVIFRPFEILHRSAEDKLFIVELINLSLRQGNMFLLLELTGRRVVIGLNIRATSTFLHET